jgi:hypothetical protein
MATPRKLGSATRLSISKYGMSESQRLSAERPGEFCPRVGFIVNMSTPAENVVAFYDKRGTREQWIVAFGFNLMRRHGSGFF